MKKEKIVVQFSSDTDFSKTPCLLIQSSDKDNSWYPLMYFKKGKHAKQENYEQIMEHFRDSFKGSC